jgi:hypothetical protein
MSTRIRTGLVADTDTGTTTIATTASADDIATRMKIDHTGAATAPTVTAQIRDRAQGHETGVDMTGEAENPKRGHTIAEMTIQEGSVEMTTRETSGGVIIQG